MADSGGRARINASMRADIANSVLCWLATVDTDGVPSVTPKEIFAAYGDDKSVSADIASTNSARNIVSHPKGCVSFVDVFRQRGFKVVGSARVVPSEHADFDLLGQDLLAMAGPDYPIRNVIAVQIEKISRIWAPSYSLFPERSEAERMDAAFAAYGVQPKQG